MTPSSPVPESLRARRAYRRGRAYLQADRADRALASFQVAARLDPSLGPAWLGAGLSWLRQGEYLEATAALRQCLELGVEDPQIPTALAHCLERLQVTAELVPRLAREVVDLLQREDVRRTALARLTADLLAQRYGGRTDVPLEVLAADPLFVHGLGQTLITRPAVEVWVAHIRRELMAVALEQGRFDAAAREVAGAIALSCFNSEYLLDPTEPEQQCLVSVRELMEGLTLRPEHAAVWSDLVLLRACYEPIADWSQAETVARLPAACLARPLRRVVVRTCQEVLEGRVLAQQLRSLTPVSDPTSQEVRSQYESNPYPRWLTLRRVAPRRYRVRPALRGAAKAWHDQAGAHLLVAGCGTGRQALEVAQAHPEARVFAVDLSRRSLAYAQRMAERLEVDNVAFAHADLLELPRTGLSFDVIECVGVLHHLREPLRGLRALSSVLAPEGLLRMDLYSRVARRELAIGQAWVRERGLTGSLEELRALRRALVAGELGPGAALALQSLDFYSASGLRDLFFHVQEHQYALPEVVALARDAHLEVLGLDDGRLDLESHWRAVHGERAVDWTDLAAWQQVEEVIPTAFVRMYPIWLRKPAESGLYQHLGDLSRSSEGASGVGEGEARLDK